MKTFDITYFDGKTSGAYQGTLTLAYAHWDIRIVLADGAIKSIHWPLKDIQPSEFMGDTNTFKYGDFPQETLECTDPALDEALRETYPYLNFFKKEYYWAIKKGTGTFLLIIGFIIALGWGVYQYILPEIAAVAAMTVPQKTEISWGETMYHNMIEENNEQSPLQYTVDDSLSVLANQFLHKIDFKTNYPLHITVVKEEQVNAFALPGGHIVVFSGILKKVKTKEAFVALLGHEATHVINRHSLKNIFKSVAGYLFVAFFTNDINGVSAIVLDNANNLSNLGYSRKLEAEADANALTIMENNKVNPNGLLHLFETLQGDSKFAPPALLSTHPLTEERITFAQQHIHQVKNIAEHKDLEIIWKQIQSQLKKENTSQKKGKSAK